MAETLTAAQLREAMKQMGARGGRIGGKRRLQTMTPKQRSLAARKAARARWDKAKDKKEGNAA